MLVAFKCAAHADIVMFGEVAVTLLKMMGMTGDVPGALRPEDLAGALAKLQRKLAAQPAAPSKPSDGDEPEAKETVSLQNRAYPLIKLLQAAIRGKKHVMWEQIK